MVTQRKALFITGYWNSGTTLLTDILRRHPQLQLRRARYKPNLEERSIVKLLRKLGEDFIVLRPNMQRIINQGWGWYRQADLQGEKLEAFRKLFWRKFGTSRGRMLLLKNPWLWFMPDTLEHAFADTEFHQVIIIRDGAQQSVSKDYWKEEPERAREKLLERARFWVRCMEFYFEHWHGRENLLTIHYEDLTTRTAEVSKMVCEHAGLSFPDDLKMPPDVGLRTSRWQKLPDDLKEEVLAITTPMQQRIEAAIPRFS